MSKHNPVPVVADPDDVQKFVDVLMKDEAFARAPDSEMAYRLALAAQQHHQMTESYTEEFARKVRDKVRWKKPVN